MKLKSLLIVLFCLALLAGCSGRGRESEENTVSIDKEVLSRETPSSRSGETHSEAPPKEESRAPEGGTVEIERRDPGRFIWYLYDTETESYIASVEEDPEPFTMTEAITRIGQRMGLSPKVSEIQRQKGMVTVSFAGDTYNGSDELVEKAFLNAVVTTILENDINAEWFTFMLDGAQYRTSNLVFELGEEYKAAPLKIGGESEDEYAGLRESVPYSGTMDYTPWLPMDYMAGSDETARRLCQYLYLFGNPQSNVGALSELTQEYIIERGLWATRPVNTDYPEDEGYRPELRAITAEVNDGTIYLKEHVESAIREIFGEVPIRHRSVSKYEWHETEGVYTPPHMGMGAGWIPVIFKCGNVEGVYTVELAFVRMGLDAVFDEDGQVIPNDKIKDHAREQPGLKAVIGMDKDGKFILHSMVFTD